MFEGNRRERSMVVVFKPLVLSMKRPSARREHAGQVIVVDDNGW